jgi:glucose-1-phosphate cytidylyltransferase
MKLYSHYGINDFIICLGYKGYVIKEFFINYFLHTSDVRIRLDQDKIDVLQQRGEAWTVTLIDTGENTLTGGRLKRVGSYLRSEEDFCFTYGDGLADEKPAGDGGWINGGFFVLSNKTLDYIENDETSWETEPLSRLAAEGQLVAYEHRGFWRPMDTLRDKQQLNEMFASGKPPWQVWD